MGELVILNIAIILIILLGLFLVKKYVKSEKGIYILFLASSLATVLCHYSMFFYHIFAGGFIDYLTCNPNLIIPIYPCNLVMVLCVVFGIMKKKTGKVAEFLIDYIFFFGVVSCLVGMFANVDFIINPTLKDFTVTKSVLAHGFMLFNVMLLPIYGYTKIDFKRNLKNIILSVIMMLIDGVYVTLIISTFASYQFAYDVVNPMFLLHSPFPEIKFLVYPVIAAIAIVLYAGIFALMQFIKNKKAAKEEVAE